MSHYIERFCAEHGEWDDDVDVPAEGCPKCIAEGKFKTRAQLLDAVAGLEAELAACRATRTAPEASLWQPFETAPEDGTHVLMYRPGHGIEEAWWKENPGMMNVHWGGNGWWYVPSDLPTHWMKIPSLPQSNGKS